MLLNCPVCRAAVDRGPQCRRCKADLSLLIDTVIGLRRQAVEALLARDFAAAYRLHQAARPAPPARLPSSASP